MEVLSTHALSPHISMSIFVKVAAGKASNDFGIVWQTFDRDVVNMEIWLVRQCMKQYFRGLLKCMVFIGSEFLQYLISQYKRNLPLDY